MKRTTSHSTDPASTSAGIAKQNDDRESGSRQSGPSRLQCNLFASGECKTLVMTKAGISDDAIRSFGPLLERGQYRVSLRGPGVCPHFLQTEPLAGGLFLTLGLDEEPLAHYGVATDEDSGIVLWNRIGICLSMARLADPRFPVDCPRPREFPWVAMIVTPDGPLAEKQIEEEKNRASARSMAIAATAFGLGQESHFLAKILIWAWLERFHREKDGLGCG